MSNKRPHILVDLSDDDDVVCLDDDNEVFQDTPKREYGERPNKRLQLDSGYHDVTPGTSRSYYEKDVKPFAEVNRCFEKLKVIFPASNEDYLQEQAEHLAGDEGAFTQFIIDNVDQELNPPECWVAKNPLSRKLPNNPTLNDVNFQTLVKEFPTVCPAYLMGIVNVYDNDGGTQIRSWLKEAKAKGLVGTLPSRRDYENRFAKRVDPIPDQRLNVDPVKHFKELRDLLPEYDPKYIKSKVEEFGGSERKKNEWVQEIMKSRKIVGDSSSMTREEFRNRERRNELEQSGDQGLAYCPFCPHYIYMYSSPEENNIFKCDECKKESCRLCKKESHSPYRCGQLVEESKEKTYEDIQKRLSSDGQEGLRFKRVRPSRSVEETPEETDFRRVESHFLRLARNFYLNKPNLHTAPDRFPVGMNFSGLKKNWGMGSQSRKFSGSPNFGGHTFDNGSRYSPYGQFENDWGGPQGPQQQTPPSKPLGDETIEYIDFVINPRLQRIFENKKEEFERRNIPNTVVFAFHGTPKENVISICQNNLNVMKRDTLKHGPGYYFSEFPDVSMGYGSGLLMFKCLIGNEYTGHGVDQSLYHGPYAKFQSKKIPSNERESEKRDYGDMLIIADNAQFVPYCLIHLSK